MRNVFLGTSEFAAGVLGRLATSEHCPVLVVTRPDRPRGRGRKLQPTPVATAASELGLELLKPEDLHAPDVLAAIATAAPDVLCVCAYGVLIREPLLSGYELVNVHPSLLPRWRGAAPIERAIMAGDARTGVSIMRLVAALDAGPVCLQEEVVIADADDAGTLGSRLRELSGELLIRALGERPPYVAQAEVGVTYAERIQAADRRVDPGSDAEVEWRRVRGLSPHIGARLELADGSFLGVLATGVEASVASSREPGGDGRLRADGDRLLLDCRDHALELLRVQPAGGKAMDAADWLRGQADRAHLPALFAEPVAAPVAVAQPSRGAGEGHAGS